MQHEKSKIKVTVRVAGESDRARIDQLLSEHHYLGPSHRVGDCLEQIIERDGQWVAVLVWGPCALKLKDRERWMGWSRTQASERLKLIAQNRRYLLLHPPGSEPNLASAALAAACRELPEQWEEHFGYRVLIAESFTDPESYAGTCYKASGWEALGMTEGNQRHRADFYQPNERPKRLWLKELSPQARVKATAARLEEPYVKAQTQAVHGILPLDQKQRHSLFEALRKAPDPRSKNTRFRIAPVLSIVAMALLCGARQVTEIHRFATRLSPKQRAELGLPIKTGTKRFYEVPGYGVFYEVLSRMQPEQFAHILSNWLMERSAQLPATLAMDGKMIRNIVGTLSLVDVEDGSPFALSVMDQKENTERCELKVAQELIESIPSLEGKTVTADALHCQKQTARAIVEKGGEYFLQIKANQPNLQAYAQQVCDKEKPLFRKTPWDTGGSKNAR